MGFFDRFRKTLTIPQAAVPPPEEAPPLSVAPPPVPFPARIAAFSGADAPGSISAEGAPPLAFARSVCAGFEPVVDARVIVKAVSQEAGGGWRADAVVLDPAYDTCDVLHAARELALGATEGHGAVDLAATTCRALGWVVVLLHEMPPTDPRAFRAWAERLGLEKRGVRVHTDGQPRLGAGTHEALVFVGPGAFPDDQLLDIAGPEGLPVGAGFLGLSLGLPSLPSKWRAQGAPRDPWAADGALRDLSRIVAAFEGHMQAVLLPQARKVLPVASFLGRLADLENPENKPFGAWIDWEVDPAESVYVTRGLSLHGLPEIHLEVDLEDPWVLDRASEALLYAAHRMVRVNTPLTTGTRVEVPVGVRISGQPVAPIQSDAERYRVSEEDGRIVLEREGVPGGTRTLWHLASDADRPDPKRIAPNTYIELFRSAFTTHYRTALEERLSPRSEPDIPPFLVEVHEARGGGAWVVTNGVGRVRQRGGSPSDGNAHVEFLAAAEDHHSTMAVVLAAIGEMFHSHDGGDDVFKAGDTVALEVPEIGAEGFVLGEVGTLELADGAPIHLLEVIPMDEDEYARARKDGSERLLEQLGEPTPHGRADRWRLRTH